MIQIRFKSWPFSANHFLFKIGWHWPMRGLYCWPIRGIDQWEACIADLWVVDPGAGGGVPRVSLGLRVLMALGPGQQLVITLDTVSLQPSRGHPALPSPQLVSEVKILNLMKIRRIRRRENLTSAKNWSFGSMLMYRQYWQLKFAMLVGQKTGSMHTFKFHILSVSPSCYWPAACGGHVLQSAPRQCPGIEAGEASLVTTGEQGHGVAGLQWPHRGVNRVCRERFAEIR